MDRFFCNKMIYRNDTVIYPGDSRLHRDPSIYIYICLYVCMSIKGLVRVRGVSPKVKDFGFQSEGARLAHSHTQLPMGLHT